MVVLDASALLALLWREPGADRVWSVINDSAISTVNFSEVIAKFAGNRSDESEIRAMLDLPMQRVDFDEELAYAAGLLLPLTRGAGLSLADRACLALAAKLGVKVLTADRPWSKIADAVGVEVELIR